MLATAAEDDRDRRGQVGIGTLIIFVAMVLVAALAAGVLFQTAQHLQSQAEATGEESTAQVANDLVVYSTVGNVDGERIETIEMTVGLNAGSNPMNLEDAIVEYSGPGNQAFLEIEEVKDGDPVLEPGNDRRTVVVGVDDLEAGDEATLTLLTDGNTQASVDVAVPYDLEGEDDVLL